MKTTTLIANTGIQFLTRKITLSPHIGKPLRFSEFFDYINGLVKLDYAFLLKQYGVTVSLLDLWQNGYIDINGELIIPECDVLGNPHIRVINANNVFPLRWGYPSCLAEKYFDHWIPVPFLEYNPQNGRYMLEPLNWCRCKIIPDKSQLEKECLKATIVFVFDTQTLYDLDSDNSYYPVLYKEQQKTYRFCNSQIGVMAFCSGNNNLILENLMKVAHGVDSMEDIPISLPGQHRTAFLASYLWLMDYIANNVDLPEVRLYRGNEQENVPVGMDIDMRDSQISIKLTEDLNLSRTFSTTEPVPLALQDFTDVITQEGRLNSTQLPFDLQIAFQIADFGFDSICCSRQFIWPSMVRIGGEALKLTIETENREIGDVLSSTFSNPHHYLWDENATTEEWHCVKEDADGRKRYPYIAGITNFFQNDGCLDKDGFGFGFHYSPSSLMTFVFMEMIAQATAQINSHDYRVKRGHVDKARVIDHVFIFCPVGMSKVGQCSIRKCFEDACFVMNHFNNYIGTAIASHQVEIIQDEQPQTNFFILMNKKMESIDTFLITPTCNCCRIIVDSFPQYIGYKEDMSFECPIKPFYILDFNKKEIVRRIKYSRQLNGLDDDISDREFVFLYEQYKKKILTSCPLTFHIERPNFVMDKEFLKIDSVENCNLELLPPDIFILTPCV